MKSPFPGMDPYLEQYWRDVHHRFLTYACDDLQDHLPGDLRARLEERVCVESDFAARHAIYPDVRVVERTTSGRPVTAVSEGEVAEPLVIHADSEPATEGFIEIIDVGSGSRVVTAIELLSDSNKQPGEGQSQYRRKQRESIQGGVNLVEIDLLRSGTRVLAVPLGCIPPSHRTTYQVCVTRAGKTRTHEVYRVPIQEPLPTIRVPLRETDPDLALNLQSLIDRCYHHGRYDDINYKVGPHPPLATEDAAWAEQLLSTAGLR